MANRIREIRKSRNMTMKQLGERIGVTESAVSQYETGKRQPDSAILLSLSCLFGVTVGYILGAEPDEKRSPTVTGEASLESTRYYELNDENRHIIDQMIEKLVKSQSGE